MNNCNIQKTYSFLQRFNGEVYMCHPENLEIMTIKVRCKRQLDGLYKIVVQGIWLVVELSAVQAQEEPLEFSKRNCNFLEKLVQKI
ncbi:hypothetical protein KFK09_029305 [Dendrobium nobile]|uniref:Uncharacterized protein n=1 Tax=Dendrobium nobile TaxID=94219 RepID=A0A8T3A5K9_DENNO|nr:hypothetical protein KFK09_029305 [Dendrobium nobile]